MKTTIAQSLRDGEEIQLHRELARAFKDYQEVYGDWKAARDRVMKEFRVLKNTAEKISHEWNSSPFIQGELLKQSIYMAGEADGKNDIRAGFAAALRHFVRQDILAGMTHDDISQYLESTIVVRK